MQFALYTGVLSLDFLPRLVKTDCPPNDFSTKKQYIAEVYGISKCSLEYLWCYMLRQDQRKQDLLVNFLLKMRRASQRGKFPC